MELITKIIIRVQYCHTSQCKQLSCKHRDKDGVAIFTHLYMTMFIIKHVNGRFFSDSTIWVKLYSGLFLVERAPPPVEQEPEPEEDRPTSPTGKKKKGKKGKGGTGGKGKSKRKSSRDTQSPTEDDDKKVAGSEDVEDKLVEPPAEEETVTEGEETAVKEVVPEVKTVTIVDEKTDEDGKKSAKKDKKQKKKGRKSPPTGTFLLKQLHNILSITCIQCLYAQK